MDIENELFNILHNLTVENKVYSTLYFGENEELTEHTFSFNFRHHNDNDGYIDDVKFLLDNIISKIFEINYDVQYSTLSRTRLGNFIHFDNDKIMNPFITNEYVILNDEPIANIDEFIDDIFITSDTDNYIVTWTLPILKLNKSTINVLE